MAKKGKKYVEAAKLVDRAKAYDVAEAVALTKKTNTAKFDATVEVAFRLGLTLVKTISKSAVQLYFLTELVKLSAC